MLVSTWVKSFFQQVLVDEPDLADSGDTKALENGADSDIDDGMDRMMYNYFISLGFVKPGNICI